MDEAPDRKQLDEMGKRWMARIDAAEERERKWIKQAEHAEAIYLCDDEHEQGTAEFNILHSNVETTVPAIYNSTPAPDVRPRHNVRSPDQQGNDPLKAFCDALERGIATQIDDDALNAEIECLAQDGEVAGRGITRIKYESDDDGSNERVVYENVSWRNYREGPATRWDNVPWVAYRYEITNEEAKRLADDEIMARYDDVPDEDIEQALWQIWDKDKREVILVLEEKSRVISIKPDPYGLKDFFPQPAPVQPITGTGKRTPVCPYYVYKRLADEMDMATRRIAKIMSGLKVRGLIAGDAKEVELIAGLADNEFAAAPDLASLAATGGISNAILWWPLDTAIAVLAQLYQQREQTKAAIYEITGISDIVRGSSDANETAAAQKIKAQWGSQRVKRRQRMIQSHVRDLFKLTAEIMAKVFTPQGFAQAAGVPLTPELQQMLGQWQDFRVDVETDSTIRADLDRQRSEMSQFLEATAGFFGIMGPLMQDKPQMAPAVAEIYGSFTRSFQLGKTAEDAIDQMTLLAQQDAANPKPNPAEEQQKADMQAKQAELQLKQGDQQLKAQEIQIKGMAAQTAAQREQQRMSIDAQRFQLDQVRLRMEAAKLAQDYGLQVRQQDIAEMQAEIDAMLRVEEMEMERDQQRAVSFGE